MQYTNAEGSQGICPAGTHIPTDNDWKILEIYLGMTQIQADASSYRGTDQGTKLKSGGISGLSMLLAGYRNTDGTFINQLTSGAIWSSSESSTNAWYRNLGSGYANIYRGTFAKTGGFSVRCIGN